MTEGLTAIVLPKAANPDEIRRLHDLLSYHEGRAGMAHGGVGILPLPETAEGMHDACALAKASPRVKGIHGAISGPVSGDFARAFGFRATTDGIEQLYLASKLVLDSRAGGAPYPIAGIFGTPMNDLAAVERLIRRARDIGYTGVAVMHPSHVAVANAVYQPDAGGHRVFHRPASGVRGGGEGRPGRGQLPGRDGRLRHAAAGAGGDGRGQAVGDGLILAQETRSPVPLLKRAEGGVARAIFSTPPARRREFHLPTPPPGTAAATTG